MDHHQEQHTAAAQHDSNPEVPSPLFNVRAAAASTTASNFVKDDKNNNYNAEDNEKNHNIQNEQVNNDRNKLALLKYGDRVTLKTLHSHCHHLHLTATNNNTTINSSSNVPSYDARIRSSGNMEEVLLLELSSSSNDPFAIETPPAATIDKNEDDAGNDQKEEDAIIFYNDTVIIRSVAAQHRALSIHRFLDTATAGNSGSHNSNDYESDERAIGFYRTWTGSCEKFIILPGNCSNPSPFTSISSAKNQKQKQKQPVCIGDMLMLRSFATGDILKVQPTGSFKNEYSLQLGRFNDDRNSDGLFQFGKADQAVNPPWLMMRSSVSSDDNESSSINYKQHDQPMYLFQKHLTDGFYADQQCSSNDHICLSKDLVEQEEYIIRNLLDALTGFSSNIFVYCAESSSFQISQKVQKTIDISFAHLSRRILPMCDNFVSVQNYVSSR